MRKYLLFIFIALLFICGCTNKGEEINKQEEQEKVSLKQEYVEVTTSFINLRDYINNEDFVVKYEDKTIKSNESLLVVLHDGLNKFDVSVGEDLKSFEIYLLRNFKINILNYNGTLKQSFSYLENSIITEDELNKYHPEEQYKNWLGYNIEFPIKVNEDLNIESLFEYLSYEVTFVYNGKSETKNIPVYSQLEFPVIDLNQYTLTGWYSNNIKFEDGDIFNPENGLTYTANLSKKLYNLTYVYNDTKKVVKIGYKDNIQEFIPNLTGYRFIGWMYNDKAFNDTIYNYNDSITLTAKFEKETYTIKYFDDLTLLKEVSISYLDKIDEYIPTKSGSRFVCWMNGTTEFSTKTYEFTSNIELKAKWEQKVSSIELNLVSLIGDVSKTCDVLDNGSVVLPSVSVDGYTFKGWYSDTFFINKVTSVIADNYNDSPLYALLEPTDDKYVGFIPFTWFNKQQSPYGEGCVYDNEHNASATLYWYKIGIIERDKKYYVSGTAASGVSLNTLTNRDYVFLSYSAYPLQSEITSYGIQTGYIIEFAKDIKTLETGDVFDVMYVYENSDLPAVNPDVDYTNVIEYLDGLYGDIETVSSNMNLVKSYSGNNIEWFSNSRMTISDAGVYNKPAVDRTVTLTAYIDDVEVYSFSFFVKGVKEQSDAITVGYIYTPYTITQTGMNCVDLIICAFLDIDGNGNFVNETSITNKMNTYIFDKAKIAGTKVSVSINQDEKGDFDTLIENEANLAKFADNVLEFVKKNHLDGIDIDWETPVESKKENFTKLMKTLYEKLKAYDPNILITAAIGGGKWQPPRYDLTNSKKYMDYINMMTYSMVSSSGYFSGPIYKSTHGKTLTSCSIEESIDVYHSYGVPNSMILVGVPFYGTKQTGTGGPGSGKGSGGSVWLDKAFAEYPLSSTMKEYFDRECCVTYRYDATQQVMICYLDERTIALKCDYINSLGLGGIMYWQYGQDINDNFSQLIAKYIRK